MNTLTIIGLGSGDIKDLTLEAYRLLTSEPVLVRTMVHPCLKVLQKQGYFYESFDYLYKDKLSFDEIYSTIIKTILKKLKTQSVYYAVPGNPMFSERTVSDLLKLSHSNGFEVKIIPGVSYIDRIADVLEIDLGNSTRLVDSYEILEDSFVFDPNVNLLIGEIWHDYYLGEIKLKLMEFYPDETEVVIVKHAGLDDQEIIRLPLFELDHHHPDHLTSLFIPIQEGLNRNFDALMGITRFLRSPDGCPWDREQTHESLKRYLIEETFEAIDALDNEDIDNLREELGDILFEVLIHAQIAAENNEFTIYDVIEDISEKMIRRHPHVFGDINVDSSQEVLTNWNVIKQKEKGSLSMAEEMNRIPKHLPSLLQSDKIQRKARSVGFDWDDSRESMDKVIEECKEVTEVLDNHESPDRLREELGDLLFATVNVARLTDIDPEEALRLANKKFINRFEKMEQEAARKGDNFSDLSLDEQEILWEKVKHQ